jgi:heparin binding hemagglutinin HbhA
MVAFPKTDDVRKAGEQAVEALRTPLLAALGAGDLATQAVRDAVNKTRTRVNESAGAARGAARGAVDELPRDLAGVRERLDPAELRKLVDEYTDAAQKLYQKLADQGEDALTKLREQPQVGKALEQLEAAIATLQDRVGDVAGDARELADEVLARVTRRTRSVGEKTARAASKAGADAARATSRAGADAAQAVEELGDDVAHEVRSASRKAANRTAPRKTTTGPTGTTGTTRKTNGAAKK